ncbi:hypothetical protein ACOSP7_016599 [Xanthoceras sorbifolium]
MGAKSENTHKQYSSGQKSRENVNANMLIRVEEGVKVSEVISKNGENNTLATVLDDEDKLPVWQPPPKASFKLNVDEAVDSVSKQGSLIYYSGYKLNIR